MAAPVLHFLVVLPFLLLIRRKYSSRHLWLLLNVLFVLIAESELSGGLNFTFFPNKRWNWIGKSAEFLLAVFIIVSSKFFTKNNAGWGFKGNPKSRRQVLAIGALFLLGRILLKLYAHQWHKVDLETVLFQATLPGLSEEAVYRGLLLGWLNKVYPAKATSSVFTNRPLLLVSFLFALAHGVRLDHHMNLIFNLQSLCMIFGLGMILGWIKQRSGGLWPAIVFHNLWNLIVFS